MKSDIRQRTPSCTRQPGKLMPVIDRNRCEGKGDCVEVCPKDVFVIDEVPKAERSELSWIGKVKRFAHGWKQAFVPFAGACEACGLCLAACPEKAIRLVGISTATR